MTELCVLARAVLAVIKSSIVGFHEMVVAMRVLSVLVVSDEVARGLVQTGAVGVRAPCTCLICTVHARADPRERGANPCGIS